MSRAYIIKLDAFRYPLQILYLLCLLCGLVDILVSTDILFFSPACWWSGSDAAGVSHWKTSSYCGECCSFSSAKIELALPESHSVGANTRSLKC